ncbi:hypothetical protein PF004_g18114 [Phytophthora fragariae]|uniref:DDE-1 domain-containing protein n=1 Tax=Phytophthora fragariae TaxID=53985 RepID=A0A6G0NDG9_9STRA|nr:hypothetical protein PF004_g18114 [Phytophthora fragariae]
MSRITLAVCTNATGSDKLPLLLIGKSVKPRWIKDKPDAIQYKSTKKAWMTTDVVEAWLKDVNASMKDQGREILMLVDNASSHCPDGIVLYNVRLEKLPPNTTSMLQPLDQGIIYCLKRDVLTRVMLHALDEMDIGNKNPDKLTHV